MALYFICACKAAPSPPALTLTCAHKIFALPIVEDLVSVRLCHAGVDEKTGVPQLCDLLCQQLHSLH